MRRLGAACGCCLSCAWAATSDVDGWLPACRRAAWRPALVDYGPFPVLLSVLRRPHPGRGQLPILPAHRRCAARTSILKPPLVTSRSHPLKEQSEQGRRHPLTSAPAPLPPAGWDPVRIVRKLGFAFFGVYGTEANPDFVDEVGGCYCNG